MFAFDRLFRDFDRAFARPALLWPDHDSLIDEFFDWSPASPQQQQQLQQHPPQQEKPQAHQGQAASSVSASSSSSSSSSCSSDSKQLAQPASSSSSSQSLGMWRPTLKSIRLDIVEVCFKLSVASRFRVVLLRGCERMCLLSVCCMYASVTAFYALFCMNHPFMMCSALAMFVFASVL